MIRDENLFSQDLRKNENISIILHISFAIEAENFYLSFLIGVTLVSDNYPGLLVMID